jgi:hypothetical protein
VPTLPTNAPTLQPSLRPSKTPTLKPSAKPTYIPTTAPTFTYMNVPSQLVPVGTPITIQILGSVFGLGGENGVNLEFDVLYSTPSILPTSQSTVSESVGTNTQYFSFRPVPVLPAESLDFSVSLASLAPGYTCYVNMAQQTVRYPEGDNGTLPSNIFSSDVLVFCTDSSVSVIQSGTSGILFPPSVSGLMPQILTPGTVENRMFSGTVGNAIANIIGAANETVQVTISYDANHNPIISIVLASGDMASSLCNFQGDVDVNVTIGGIEFTVRVVGFQNQVTDWALAQFSKVASFPLHIVVPVGVVVLAAIVALGIKLHRTYPNQKLKPFVSLFISAPGIVTNFMFLNYLYGLNRDLVSNSMCSVSMTVNPLSQQALSMFLAGCFCFFLNSLICILVTSRLLCHCWSASKHVLNQSSLDIKEQWKKHRLEEFKKKYKVAITVAVLLAAFSPSHVMILGSNLCERKVFRFVFPTRLLASLDLLELFPLFLVFIPFAALQLVASVHLSGWNKQVILCLVMTSIQALVSCLNIFFGFCNKKFNCVKRLTKAMKRCCKKYILKSKSRKRSNSLPSERVLTLQSGTLYKLNSILPLDQEQVDDEEDPLDSEFEELDEHSSASDNDEIEVP